MHCGYRARLMEDSEDNVLRGIEDLSTLPAMGIHQTTLNLLIGLSQFT